MRLPRRAAWSPLVLSIALVTACGDDAGGGSGGDGGSGGSVLTSGPGTGATGSTGSGSGSGPAALCVDTINMYRATLGLPPYERWTDAEACSDGEAASDSQTGQAHGAFGDCGEFAQNECPGWPGPPEDMITGCLDLMWQEGPGQDFSKHGHYINMSSTDYTRAACGFHTLADGSVWAVQNFK